MVLQYFTASRELWSCARMVAKWRTQLLAKDHRENKNWTLGTLKPEYEPHGLGRKTKAIPKEKEFYLRRILSPIFFRIN